MIGLGRGYKFVFDAVSVAAQQDFFYIKPAADKIVIVESVYIAVIGGAADAGDAQEELLDVKVIRVPATVTASSGGAASATGTLNPIMVNDTAPSFTARSNDTTKAVSSGTVRIMHSDGMNSRIPFVYMAPPEHREPVANAEAIVVRLNTTPADALTMNGTIILREMP